MRRSLAALIGLVALASAPVALAQRTTGALVGTVTDDSGAVLPGVAVSLKGEAVVGTQTATSNEKGYYRFAALPPGTYTVSFALSGFGTLTRQGIRVSLGGTSEENVALKLSAMSEEVTVTGESTVVDTTSNEMSTNYDKEWVRNAPVPRFSFFDLINAAPGVNQNNSGDARSTSFGSGTTDNSYQLDGTDFTAPSTGASWPYPNTDAIEEVQVLSLGAPAEYGNLQGAVFNIVTRQGSNSFHGDANFYFQDNGLTSNNTTSKLSDGSFADACSDDPTKHCPFHRTKFNDLTLQLSGPIVKDKLWFFGSYQYQRDFAAPAGTPPAFPSRTQADRMFLKLNYQINAANKLQFAYHDDFYRIPYPVVSCTAVNAPSTCNVEHGHNPSPNLTYTNVISEKTYVEARVSGFYGHDHSDPLQGGPRVATRYKNVDTGEVTGGIYSWYDGTISKTAVSAKVSHFADSFLGGSHDFKFGVQYNRGGTDYVVGPNDYIYSYGPSYDYPDGHTYGFTQKPYHTGGRLKTIGVFLDDSYRVGPRLTLNLGVRWDHSTGYFASKPILDKDGNPTGQTSRAIDNLFTRSNLSPRLGFSLKLTGDGKTVLKGHYGRYYGAIHTGEFESLDPARSAIFAFSSQDAQGNPIDPVLIADNSQLSIDPHFKASYTDQFIAQFEREIVKDLGISLNYIHKRGGDYGAYKDIAGQYAPVPFVDNQDNGGTDFTGQTYTFLQLQNGLGDRRFVLTNPGEMFSRYNGFTAQLTKHMSHSWEATASLVVSKSKGRLASSLGAPLDEQASGAILGVRQFGQDPNDYSRTDGLLIADRPVAGKLQVVYELPKGFLIGINFTHQSGRPWGRLLNVSDVVNVPKSQQLAAPLDGSHRVGDWNVLDARVQKQFTLSKDAKLGLFADLLNLTNNAAFDSVGDRLGTSSNYGLPTAFIPPRRLMLGAKFTF
jgi:outer membrane receptor protein involved in Fe transport